MSVRLAEGLSGQGSTSWSTHVPGASPKFQARREISALEANQEGEPGASKGGSLMGSTAGWHGDTEGGEGSRQGLELEERVRLAN